MNRILQWINLGGVLILATICGMQWIGLHRLGLENRQLIQKCADQQMKLDRLGVTTEGQTSDIEKLRKHLAQMAEELEHAETKMAASEIQAKQTAQERDQLKASMQQWIDAVAARDERIKKDAAQLGKLSQERGEAVKSFNDLAGRHNLLVSNWNTLQLRLEEQSKTNAKSMH